MAVTLWNVALFLLAFMSCCNSSKHRLNNYKLNTLCNKTFDMAIKNVTSGVIDLQSREARSRRGYLCNITFKAPPEKQVLMRFVNEDIKPSNRRSCNDYVWIYERKGWEGDPIKVPICGNDPPNRTFRSAAMVMVIYVHFHDYPLATDEGYKLFFNAFHGGPCKKGEYECDNDYCIDSRLRCNGYNNCGDGSDSCSSDVPILLGAAAGIVMLCLSVGLLYCCKKQESRRHSKRREETDVTEITQITSTVANVSSPGYVSLPCPSWEKIALAEFSKGPSYSCGQPDGHPSELPKDEDTDRPPKYSASNKGYEDEQDLTQAVQNASQNYDPPPRYSPRGQVYPPHA